MTTLTATTVPALASQIADMFVREIRGEDKEAHLFLKETEGEPSRHDAGHPYNWVTQMVMDAPDCNLEESYEEVYEALLHISENADNTSGVDEVEYQEADIYTHDLLKWLSADVSRLYEVNAAIEETQKAGDISVESAIQYAQSEWRRSVLVHVWETLEGQIEDADDDSDEEDEETAE